MKHASQRVRCALPNMLSCMSSLHERRAYLAIDGFDRRSVMERAVYDATPSRESHNEGISKRTGQPTVSGLVGAAGSKGSMCSI